VCHARGSTWCARCRSTASRAAAEGPRVPRCSTCCAPPTGASKRRPGARGRARMAERMLSDILEETFARCRDLEVPLADRLQAFATEVRRMGPQFTVAVDDLVHRLMENGAGAAAPK